MDSKAASALRQRLRALRQERERLERSLLEPARLLRGSLLERYSLAGGEKRSRPAYYLSVPVGTGRTRFTYIRKKHLERARREAEAYKRYRLALKRLRALSREILVTLAELLKVQEISPP